MEVALHLGPYNLADLNSIAGVIGGKRCNVVFARGSGNCGKAALQTNVEKGIYLCTVRSRMCCHRGVTLTSLQENLMQKTKLEASYFLISNYITILSYNNQNCMILA